MLSTRRGGVLTEAKLPGAARRQGLRHRDDAASVVDTLCCSEGSAASRAAAHVCRGRVSPAAAAGQRVGEPNPWSVSDGSTRSKLGQWRELSRPSRPSRRRSALAPWPFGPDPPHDPSIASAAPNITPARMHSSVRVPITFAARRVGRWQLRRPREQRLGRGAHAGLDHAAEEDAVRRDAVVGRGGAEVDDDRVAPVEAARGERVDDAIGAHGARLVHLQRDGKRRAPSTITGRRRTSCGTLEQGLAHRGTTDAMATPVTLAGASPDARSAWRSNADLVGGARQSVVSRQCARSVSPSKRPMVVSVAIRYVLAPEPSYCSLPAPAPKPFSRRSL